MNKIGTHNSGTGERGAGLLSWLVTPFARCQRKTIVEQYEAGCRYFDLRVRRNNKDIWVFAHGLWKSKKRVATALAYLNEKAKNTDETIYVNACYEGHTDGEQFVKSVDKWVKRYPYIRWVCASMKKPEWQTLKVYSGVVTRQAFQNLGEVRNMWLPIPWLWWKIKGQATFDEENFTLVDFL